MASQLFLEKIQGNILSGEQTYTYGCSFLTRNGKCASERGISSFGPKRLSACRRHGRMYDEEHQRLVDRLKMDHDQGFHGTTVESRTPFAEMHTDDSGFFSLRCGQCEDANRAEELGVSPDKVEKAAMIQRYVEKVQTGLDNVKTNFMSYAESHSISYSWDRFGDEIRSLDRQAAYIKSMLNRMNGNGYSEAKMDIVDAYDATVEPVKENLLKNHLDEDADRRAAVRFIELGRYY